jgi:hypothetical protein
MTISDLESVSCSDTAKYGNTEYSDIVAMLKDEISQEQFLQSTVSSEDLIFIAEPVQLSFLG